MQFESVAKQRILDAMDREDDSTPRMAFRQQVMEMEREEEVNLMDENNMERIFSRPAITRRKLDLFEAPEFTQRLSSYTEAEVGESVTFSGQYRAFPKPTVKWFKDEEEIKETLRHRLDLSSESDGIVRLVIQEVIKPDEGAYKCKVENQEGVASTTGYLSVSGRPYDRSPSLQTKKFAADRVSTPPYLRPIVEQKSMEEREEKEYKFLPPSPLQEFMDKIRHSAKTMHEPIVYGNLENLYSDDEEIKDFDEDDTEEEEEEEVFNKGQNASATPSGSPVEEDLIIVESRETKKFDATRGNRIVKAVDLFVSPNPKSSGGETSNEDSAYDSDSQMSSGGEETLPPPTAKNVGDSSRPVQAPTPTRTHLQTRRSKLPLQRSLAVEIPEGEVVVVEKVNVVAQSQRVGKPLKEVVGASSSYERRRDEKDGVATSAEDSTTTTTLSQDLCDLALSSVDSRWIQFYLVSCLGATSFSLATDVPLLYLVTALVLLCLVAFQILEQQQAMK